MPRVRGTAGTKRRFFQRLSITEYAESARLQRQSSIFPPFTTAFCLLVASDMLAEAPFNAVTREVIGAAIEVHRALGPGLLESAYMPCLQLELGAPSLRFVTQRVVPIVYKERVLETACRIDLIVEDVVVVEVKSVAGLLPVHQAQVLTYMRLTGCPAGLLINFNSAKLVDGVKRLINTRAEDSARR